MSSASDDVFVKATRFSKIYSMFLFDRENALDRLSVHHQSGSHHENVGGVRIHCAKVGRSQDIGIKEMLDSLARILPFEDLAAFVSEMNAILDSYTNELSGGEMGEASTIEWEKGE